jgi:hypothetical protein
MTNPQSRAAGSGRASGHITSVSRSWGKGAIIGAGSVPAASSTSSAAAATFAQVIGLAASEERKRD